MDDKAFDPQGIQRQFRLHEIPLHSRLPSSPNMTAVARAFIDRPRQRVELETKELTVSPDFVVRFVL